MKKLKELFALLWDGFLLVAEPGVYHLTLHRMRHSEKGKSVQVWVPAEEAYVGICLQRKLTPADVHDGKLVSVVVQKVVRRGGKRVTALTLSPETADDLYRILGPAVRAARQKARMQRIHKWIDKLFADVMAVLQSRWNNPARSIEVIHEVE